MDVSSHKPAGKEEEDDSQNDPFDYYAFISIPKAIVPEALDCAIAVFDTISFAQNHGCNMMYFFPQTSAHASIGWYQEDYSAPTVRGGIVRYKRIVCAEAREKKKDVEWLQVNDSSSGGASHSGSVVSLPVGRCVAAQRASNAACFGCIVAEARVSRC